MPLTPEQVHARVQEVVGPDGRLPAPPVADWDVFPFEAEADRVVVRRLRPPVVAEAPRSGEAGDACFNCAGDGEAGRLWENERWKVTHPPAPTGLPFVAWLVSKDHLDYDEMDDELASEHGRVSVWLARAIGTLPHVGRVHVNRWGDGSAHLHVWFLARPARFEQVRGSMAVEWDGILPPGPEDVWRADLAAVAAALAEHDGVALV